MGLPTIDARWVVEQAGLSVRRTHGCFEYRLDFAKIDPSNRFGRIFHV
jgi:hypothetical protein